MMTSLRRPFSLWLVIVTALFVLSSASVQAAGTFRFLNTAVPDGTQDIDYVARLVTSNATAPVEYSLDNGCGGACGPLPTGLSLNLTTGVISGVPTQSGSFNLTFVADDGAIQTTLTTTLTIAANAGSCDSSIATALLPDGRIGVPYSLTMQAACASGTITWVAQDLPSAVTLNGSTGELSGTPKVAGTFLVTFTLNDAGTGNRVLATLPMKIYPAASVALPAYLFQFDMMLLNNGEVGTAYSDNYVIADEEGNVTFSATGLPPGLTLDGSTGIVSGTPTTAGTFYVTINATDDGTNPATTITMRLPLWIAPSSTSHFYWNAVGVPAALYGVTYTRSPGIFVDTSNGSTVTYSAAGLPQGIAYNSSTGELTGSSNDVGVYPVTYTASDSPSGELLTLSSYFIVLPPGGGDANKLATNLWIKKLGAKVNTNMLSAPNDSWQAQYIYNADRRSGKVFNPATQSMELALTDSTGTIAPMYFKQSSNGVLSYKTAKGLLPALQVKGAPSSQTLSVKISSTELGFTVLPATLVNNTVALGNRAYTLKMYLDSKGKFTPTSSNRSASFVVSAAKVKDAGSTKDSAQLSIYLADPELLSDFAFVACDKPSPNCNQPIVSLRLYDGVNVILDKDITALVAATRKIDASGHPQYAMKKVVKVDHATENTLTSFSFTSKTGLVKIALKNLSLVTPLPSQQSLIGAEIKIGSASYFTSFTLFESAATTHSYSTSISKYASPFL